MWKSIFYTFLLFIISAFTVCEPLHSSEYSIVFVHIGNKVPKHAETAFSQARLFNPDCNIFLIADQEAIDQLSLEAGLANIVIVPTDSLNKTKEHLKFIKNCTLDGNWRNGFWRFTSERFLYLQDLMVQYNLQNVFHLEYDNMLYTNLNELLPIFEQKYPGIGATFDNDERCIAGFIYISNPTVMTLLAGCFAHYANKQYNDMQTLAAFRSKYDNNIIDNLPITTPEYVAKESMVSNAGHQTSNKQKYCKNIDLFQSIFDAAAIGQYLGGVDPIHGFRPKFVNESCLFNSGLLTYEWKVDSAGRKVPYACYAGKKYKINSLHIHSKQLELFSSVP